MNYTFEERQAIKAADRIKADKRRQLRKARPKREAPVRSERPDSALRERRPEVKDKARLAWVRRLPCLACARLRRAVTLGCDAAHVRHRYGEATWSHTGKGERSGDDRTVPFCRACHEAERQGRSETVYWTEILRLHPPAVIARLNAAYAANEDGAKVIMEIARWA